MPEHTVSSSSVSGKGQSRAIWWLVLAAVIVCTFSLGCRDLWAPDEPKYALVAREMMETGEFLVPHVNGAFYPDKPPLLFWLIALSSLITGGVGQAAATLPSLLAMIATLLGTARITRLVGRGFTAAPLLAVGILAASYRLISQATVGQIDMLLCALTTWAFVFLIEALWAQDEEGSRAKLCVAFAFIGLGILAKGPVALICPLGGFLVGGRLAGRRNLWRKLLHPLPWLAMFGIVAAWIVPAGVHALSTGQGEWLQNILFRQTVVRYAASWHHFKPFYYLFTVPWYDFLPGAILLPPALLRLLRPGAGRGRPEGWTLLAGSCLFILIFFSIPSGKRAVYLMPMYPLLAAWLGLDLAERLHEGGMRLRPLRVGAAGIGIGLLVVGAALLALPRFAESGAARGAIELLEANPVAYWAPLAGLFLAGAASLYLAWSRNTMRALAIVACSFGMVYSSLFLFMYPALDPLKSARPFVENIRHHTVHDAKGAMVAFRAQFVFHAGQLETAEPNDTDAMHRLGERLASEQPYWVIIRINHVEALQAALPPHTGLCRVFAQQVGGKRYLLLANEAALRSSPSS